MDFALWLGQRCSVVLRGRHPASTINSTRCPSALTQRRASSALHERAAESSRAFTASTGQGWDGLLRAESLVQRTVKTLLGLRPHGRSSGRSEEHCGCDPRDQSKIKAMRRAGHLRLVPRTDARTSLAPVAWCSRRAIQHLPAPQQSNTTQVGTVDGSNCYCSNGHHLISTRLTHH